VNGFIDHLYTSLGTTSIYSAIANLHTLQITTAQAKFLQPGVAPAAVLWQQFITEEIFQLPLSDSLFIAALFTTARTELISIVNSTIAPSLLSLSCRI
jgi:hypothetical protein